MTKAQTAWLQEASKDRAANANQRDAVNLLWGAVQRLDQLGDVERRRALGFFEDLAQSHDAEVPGDPLPEWVLKFAVDITGPLEG